MKEKLNAVAAAVVRERKGGKLEFLILQRHPKSSLGGKWQLPSGKPEEGEVEIDTIRRELREETRFPLGEPEFAHYFERSLQGDEKFRRNTHIVYVKSNSEPILSDEHVDKAWVTEDQLHNYDLMPGTREALGAAASAIKSHRLHMEVALSLAKMSIDAGKVHKFYTGAVLLPKGGEGMTVGYKGEFEGQHAEQVAIDKIGRGRAKGATLYTLLEPCTRRDGVDPCAKRIVDAGISKVVVAVLDKNPKIKGTGISFLRDNGVEVVLFPVFSKHARAAEKLNQDFFRAKRLAAKTISR